MTKSIALFDIDNTIYKGFSYFELLKAQIEEGLLAAATLDEAMRAMQQYKSGLTDYETTITKLLDIYAKALAGVKYEAVHTSTKAFYASSNNFFAYTRPVFRQLQNSHEVALVTGEPQFVAEAVAALYGGVSYYSSEFAVQEGKFTGKVASYLASRHEKLEAIQHLMQGHAAKGSFAFGDSEGDIEMLSAAEHAICLNPTNELKVIAAERGWHIPATDEVTELVDKLLKTHV